MVVIHGTGLIKESRYKGIAVDALIARLFFYLFGITLFLGLVTMNTGLCQWAELDSSIGAAAAYKQKNKTAQPHRHKSGQRRAKNMHGSSEHASTILA